MSKTWTIILFTRLEFLSNWGASLLEDGLVVGALWLAYQHPLWFGGALLVTVVFTGSCFDFFSCGFSARAHLACRVG